MLRIALCSPGLTRQDVDARSVGLDFLARLIHQKYKTEVAFYTIAAKDVLKLDTHDVDYLFVSFVGSGSALAYAKAVRFKKAKPFTAIGGPAMLFPAAFREMADVIMVGRGEDAIFSLLDHDYTGMMARDSTLGADTVYIGKPTLLSPGQESVGCLFRCGFCSYSWMHTFGTCKAARCLEFTSNRVAGAPSAEQMFKDLRFSMLSTSPYQRTIAGLDVLTPLDVRLVKKPVSFALIRSVLRRMSEDSRKAFQGMYQLRLFTVTGYPWNDDPCDLQYLTSAVQSVEFPEGVSLMIDLTLNHFIPQICTPFECCAVRLDDMRKRFESYTESQWPTSGAFIHIDRHLIPSPMQAVQQVVLMRATDPGVVPHVAGAHNADALADQYPELVGWQDSKPAPWIRRNNDNTSRVKRFYDELRGYAGMEIPTPRGYAAFNTEPDRYGLPIADFGKREQRKRSYISHRLAMEL